jgi:hypothetical protein
VREAILKAIEFMGIIKQITFLIFYFVILRLVPFLNSLMLLCRLLLLLLLRFVLCSLNMSYRFSSSCSWNIGV